MKGFCPSFVTVEGGQLKKPKAVSVDGNALPPIPEPTLPDIDRAYGVLVTGVGGTGVVTIGALLGMAAHLENKGVTVLDVTGLAQKGGAVMSHVQISHAPTDIHATRIAMGEADLVIGCDAIVTAGDECTSRMRHDTTRVVVNSAQTPTAEFIKNPNWAFPACPPRTTSARQQAKPSISSTRTASRSRCSATRSTRTRSCSATRGKRAGCR